MNNLMRSGLVFIIALALGNSARAQNSTEHFKQGVQFYVNEDYRGALREFQASNSTKDAGISDAAICLTQVHLGDIPGAIASYKRHYSRFDSEHKLSHAEREVLAPTSLMTLFEKEPNHYPTIKPFVDAYIAAEPSSAVAYKLLAGYGFEAGEKESLRQAISKLKEIEPNTPELLFFRVFSVLSG